MSFTQIGYGAEETERRKTQRWQEQRWRAADLFIKTYGPEAFADLVRDGGQPEADNMERIMSWLT